METEWSGADLERAEIDGCVRRRRGHQVLVFYELREIQNKPMGLLRNDISVG